MAIDIFANNASATVSAGGTTAPAAGTSESWTLSNILGLVASAAATQMRIVDPAASSEIILLTNLSGTTATVTRGAEGTAPVAHAANFTVQTVATADALSSLLRPDYAGLQGFLTWVCDPLLCNTSLATAGSRMFAARVPWPVTALASYLHTFVTAAEVGTGSVNALAIYDSAGNLKCQAGGAGSTIFSTTGALRAAINGGPVLIPGDPQGIILGLLQNASTTNPKFAVYEDSVTFAVNTFASGAVKIRHGVQSTTSQYTLPTTVNIDTYNASDMPWMAVS